LAKSPACVVGQRFLPHGDLMVMLLVCLAVMLFVGVISQHFLLRGHLMATLLVKNVGIKLGHLCGGERRGK
jgi:hypothetical protein